MALVQIAKNAVVAKLINPTREVKSFVTTLLSYQVEGGLGGSEWSGKSSFFSITLNSFSAGFVYLVQQELQAIGHTVQIITKPLAVPLGPEYPVVDALGNSDPRYDYQLKALRQVEKHGAGIIRVATGGGKSRIAKMIMARYRRPTLFVTTRGILLHQMDAQLRQIGMNTGQIGDGELRMVKGVNLGMVQTLIQALEEPSLDGEIRSVVKTNHSAKSGNPNISRAEIVEKASARFEAKVAKRNAILKFLEMIEVVIGEEAHEVGGDSYFEILKHCKNATIRVALTATPFMRSSAPDNMRLMAGFGPILIDISEKLLIDRGILARPIFKFVDAPAHPKLHRTSPFERAYTFGYVENTALHDLVVRDALLAAQRGLPVMTLVGRVKLGDVMLRAFTAAGLKYVFLQGADDMDNRLLQLQRLANGELNGVIGTTILDVGVDVPSVGLIQLAGGGKAEVGLRQRIGRGLRAKKLGPNISFVVDYSCNLNSYLRDHARMREGILRQIEGFAENILPAGEDLPWHLFPPK
jgi:superfamily II DNA or RNA helicase